MLGVDEAHRLAERRVIERGRARGIAHDAQYLAVVLTAVGHRRVGRVRHLQGELAQRSVRGRERGLASGELLLQCAGRGDLRGTLVRARRADLLRRGVLSRAQPFDFGRERAVRGVGREHGVDQAGVDPLALDAGAVLRLVAQPAEIDHESRTWVRSSSSHFDASRHAFVAAVRRACAS